MTSKKSFLLRMNPDLYEVYETWAADELRSVNSHLEFILRDAAIRAGRWPKAKSPGEIHPATKALKTPEE